MFNKFINDEVDPLHSFLSRDVSGGERFYKYAVAIVMKMTPAEAYESLIRNFPAFALQTFKYGILNRIHKEDPEFIVKLFDLCTVKDLEKFQGGGPKLDFPFIQYVNDPKKQNYLWL